MAGISWWRSWHGAPTDHKWPVIAMRAGVKVGIVSAVAWALFDYASQHQDRGTVTGFDVEEYSVYSGFEETEIAAVITAMTDKGIITNGRLTNWEKRQPQREDPTVSQRVAHHREMKRNVTQCNAPETEKDTDKESDNRLTEKDTEAEPEARPLLFSLYEREIGTLSPMMVDTLKMAEKEYPLEWFIDAFKEAVNHNARSWKYINVILIRWKTQGREELLTPKKDIQGHWVEQDGKRYFQET